MSAWGHVDGLLAEAVGQGVLPGAQLVVRSDQDVLHRWHGGQAELAPSPRPVAADTPFDLASLTKVLCTTPVAHALAGQGVISLDDPLHRWLPAAMADVSLAQLLSHSSGLAAWADLSGMADVGSYVSGLQPEVEPGTVHRYSDLGFLLLGLALESAGAAPLDRLFDDLVAAPSGADLRWGWPGAAATEDCATRGRIIGTVHDMNAHVLGGVAPHAGLFGTAEQVAACAAWQLRAFHGEEAGLDPATIRSAWTTRGSGSHWLGWDGVSPGGSAGPRWPTDGVGHLAFTGCSLWMAPAQKIVVAVVSNRVHPRCIHPFGAPLAPALHAEEEARHAAHQALRPALHTAVVAALAADGLWDG